MTLLFSCFVDFDCLRACLLACLLLIFKTSKTLLQQNQTNTNLIFESTNPSRFQLRQSPSHFIAQCQKNTMIINYSIFFWVAQFYPLLLHCVSAQEYSPYSNKIKCYPLRISIQFRMVNLSNDSIKTSRIRELAKGSWNVQKSQGTCSIRWMKCMCPFLTWVEWSEWDPSLRLWWGNSLRTDALFILCASHIPTLNHPVMMNFFCNWCISSMEKNVIGIVQDAHQTMNYYSHFNENKTTKIIYLTNGIL